MEKKWDLFNKIISKGHYNNTSNKMYCFSNDEIWKIVDMLVGDDK